MTEPSVDPLTPDVVSLLKILETDRALTEAQAVELDLELLAEEQRALSCPMKDKIEISASGRVRQTAFHPTVVKRRFRTEYEGVVEREVPGSFCEFITRSTHPGSDKLDLGFDSANAQSIFAMTSAQQGARYRQPELPAE